MKSIERRGKWSTRLLLAPSVGWIIVFVVLPLGALVYLSVLTRGTYGDFGPPVTFGSYARVADPLVQKTVVRSLLLAGATTALCLGAGFPIAYSISRSRSSARYLLLLAILLPFWTNFVVRIFGWYTLLQRGGLLSSLMEVIGLVEQEQQLLFTIPTVLLGMVYGYLPLMVLPLFGSLERIPDEVLWAARDLGGSRSRIFLTVVLPLARPGIVAGAVLVFIPSLGEFVVPDLLGGAKVQLIGTLIRDQFLAARDWPFGAALTLVLICGASLGAIAILMARRRLEHR